MCTGGIGQSWLFGKVLLISYTRTNIDIQLNKGGLQEPTGRKGLFDVVSIEYPGISSKPTMHSDSVIQKAIHHLLFKKNPFSLGRNSAG